MKIPHHKSKEKKDKIQKVVKDAPKSEKVLIIAQEIKLARLLSGNEKKSRDKALKNLKKLLLNCFEKKYDFKEDDFVRMWKGLYYAVWMSDMPLVQEELCESISAILDLFPQELLKQALLMFKAGLRVLATEWYGLDFHRMDKFLMLVRRYIRASLRCLLRSEWSVPSCVLYANMLTGSDGIFALKTPKYARNSMSLLLHVMDCYLEEIAKVSMGEIPGEALAELLRPVCAYMCGGEQMTLCSAARRVLTVLLRQSEAGIKYQHATRAWQKMGCPEGGPEALELVSDDEDDTEDHNGDVAEDEHSSEKPLDPRAGRVDVELPLLPVPAELLASMLHEMLAKASGKAHKRVRICLQRFEQLSRDEYPLTVEAPEVEADRPPAATPGSVVRSLHALDKKLVSQSDELALRGLTRKHRKRLLAKSRSGLSIVEDVEAVRKKISNATNGAWQVESTEPEPKKSKQDTSNKENRKRKQDTEKTELHKKRKLLDSNGDVTDKHTKSDSKKVKLNSNIKNKSKKDKHKKKANKINNNSDKVIKTNDNNTVNDKVNDRTNITLKNKNVIDIHKKMANKFNKVSDKVDDTIKVNDKTIINKPVSKENKVNVTPLINGKNKTVAAKTQTIKGLVINGKIKKAHMNQSKKMPLTNGNNQKHSLKSVVSPKKSFDTPKKVKFVLKNNSMQAPVDYYKSIRQSPNIPFDGTKKPTKTNLKPSTPSPINPFHKKKLKLKKLSGLNK